MDYRMNATYEPLKFTKTLGTQWRKEKQEDFKDEKTGAEVFTRPFQICLLPNFLSDENLTKRLVNEIIHKVHWSRKQMDLYEFYQSNDLSNLPQCRLLGGFLQLLRNKVRPWLERMTGLQLDYVSASCSMYTVGDYLLVHDDLLKDRQIAFIYYLSPWDSCDWQEDYGGCLEIFNSDEHCHPIFPVCRKIKPCNNRFVFFQVGSRSFHQVGEVVNCDFPRLTINGWFHGESNADIAAETFASFHENLFEKPNDGDCNLDSLINPEYLPQTMRQSIQNRVEHSSEICLQNFLQHEIFKQIQEQLVKDDTLQWEIQGPAYTKNYEVLRVDTASGLVAQLLQLFSSKNMLELLRDYTDLDLAGKKAVNPGVNLELQRWTHGNYTVLGNSGVSEERTLDLHLYFNATPGAGVISYLAAGDDDETSNTYPNSSDSDEDSVDADVDVDVALSRKSSQPTAPTDTVLLTITPLDNSLNLVYRCEGTARFTKYISHKLPMKNGPVFILSCRYKE